MASKCSASLGLFLALNLLLCNLAFSNNNNRYQYEEPPQYEEPQQYPAQYEEPPQYEEPSQYEDPQQYQSGYQPHGYGYGYGYAKCKSLDLDVCADVLNGVVHAQIGGRRRECCSLIENLVSFDATVCLCSVIRVNLLDIVKLSIGVDLSVLINNQCHQYYQFPSGVYCPEY